MRANRLDVDWIWHPYPKERPSSDGYYLVTFSDQYLLPNSTDVDIVAWVGKFGYYNAESKKESALPYYKFYEIEDEAITAWGYLPSGYRE